MTSDKASFCWTLGHEEEQKGKSNGPHTKLYLLLPPLNKTILSHLFFEERAKVKHLSNRIFGAEKLALAVPILCCITVVVTVPALFFPLIKLQLWWWRWRHRVYAMSPLPFVNDDNFECQQQQQLFLPHHIYFSEK